MAKQALLVVYSRISFLLIFVTFWTVHQTQTVGINFPVKDFGENVTKLLDGLLSNYDRRIRPGFGSGPTIIQVNMNVRSMGPFSEKEESYAMQLYLRQMWTDHRLSFDKHILSGKGDPSLSMNWMFANKIWKPDSFFINGKNSYFHQISAPNMFIRLKYDGVITWSMRLTVRATCVMRLRKFPLDTQHCPLIMASYGYNSSDVRYQWDPNKNVQVSPDVSIAQYELVDISESNDTVNVRDNEKISTLSVKFHLRRQTGFFLLQVYIPCILIVCCSWVAFWITKKDVPGRVCLGFNGVLSMTKLSIGGRSDYPPVSYATALDYFTIVCFVFVFGSIVEYTMVHFWERKANKRRRQAEEWKAAKERELRDLEERSVASGTMIVTTKVEEGKPPMKESIRQLLKIPLTVVPPADKVVVIEDADIPVPYPGHTTEGVKSLLKVPLTVMPEGPEALTSSELIREEGFGAVSSALADVPSKAKRILTLNQIKARKWLKAKPPKEEEKLQVELPKEEASKGVADVEKQKGPPSVIVDVTQEDKPPTKTVTIWELLMKKRKLMLNMAPYYVIPAEDDVLDRFSIVDLYARRIFPSLFFFFITLYWVLFNYYITDEFPEEDDLRPPVDGLVVT